MPISANDIRKMAVLSQAGRDAIARIERRLDVTDDVRLTPVFDDLRVLYDVLRKMGNVVGPVVNAAERMAEEYHQLKEELEDQN